MMRLLRRLLVVLVSLLLAACIWLPCLHLFYAEDVSPYFQPKAVPERVHKLAAHQMHLWQSELERSTQIERMRRSNAEWDFMGRTFLCLAMANLALRQPEEATRYLQVMQRIIDETLALEDRHGMFHFLMPYARRGAYLQSPPRSVFVDGEIALMLGARRLVGETAAYVTPFKQRIKILASRLSEAPNHCGECYPNEGWMFCNAVAMVALRMSDVLDGTDHRGLIRAWLQAVRKNLTDAATGLLVSSFTYQGKAKDGPEGSTIWFVAHCLDVLDPVFAKDQYRRARRHIGHNVLGFGYASEWPSNWVGPRDVDSGAVIPWIDVSAGASGMAFLGAAGFKDRRFLRGLLTTLDFVGFPTVVDGRMHNAASNQVGDAVLLYSLSQGPLWQKLARSAR